MQAEILSLLKDTVEAMGAQIMFLKPPYEEWKKVDLGISDKIFGDFDYMVVLDEMIKSCEPNTLYLIKNKMYMYHSYFSFPDNIREEYGYTHCFIGPFLESQLTDEEFSELIRNNNINPSDDRNIRVFYSQIPIMNSLEWWNSVLLGFCKRIFKEEPHLIKSELSAESLFSIRYNSFSVQPDVDFATEIVEKRYKLENQFLESVRKGDFAEATQKMNDWVKFRILPRHGDAIRDVKDLMIVVNTLLRKTVEQANVHPVYIDELSRRQAIEIESMTSVGQLHVLRAEMVHKYCLLVNNYSRSGYSQLIHRCLDYVDFHYMEQITLRSLADQFYVSNTHLSALFKKEVDMNLKEYIQEVRLRQARLMLNTTRLPIQEIATGCGFLDVNYFTRVFRKVHGISPRAYRNKMQNIIEE